jgi:hypothetical protein
VSGGARPGPVGAGGICPGNCHAPNGSVFPRAGSSLAGPLGALTAADMEAMRQWITGSPTTPTPPSAQERAKALVAAFAARTGPGTFTHLIRADVAKGLTARVDQPSLINQAASSLCGPSALLLNLATRDPLAYVKFVIALYERGEAHVGQLQVKPGKDLRSYDPRGKIEAADWIGLASLRDSENWFFDYQSVDDEFPGITLPSHLEGWFKKIGFSKVVNETNLVFGKAESSIREADRLYHDDYWVCLFINANLLSGADQGAGSTTPDHWVVLQSKVDIAAGVISFDVYTWGDGHRHVPSSPPLSLAAFARNYYGYVAAKY